MGVKKKDDIKVTERKLLLCFHGQARVTDERRPKIKRPWVFPEKKYKDFQGNPGRRNGGNSE